MSDDYSMEPNTELYHQSSISSRQKGYGVSIFIFYETWTPTTSLKSNHEKGPERGFLFLTP